MNKIIIIKERLNSDKYLIYYAYCSRHYFLCSKIFLLHTQQHIVANTILYVPRSSSCTHQVSDCYSNLVSTPSSSIDLTSQSVPHLSLSFLCRIFLILDKLKIEMNKDSLNHAAKNGEHSYGENMHNAAKNGEHSCVENFRGDNLNPHNINKLSCTNQSLQETQHLCHPEHCLIFVGNIKPPRDRNTLHGNTSSLTMLGKILNNPLYLMAITT